jgi:hypothetical protein
MTVRNTLSTKLKLTLYHVLAFSLIYKSQSWQQWNYSSFTTDDWRDTWGFAEGPRGRQGHSWWSGTNQKSSCLEGETMRFTDPMFPRRLI